MSDKSSSMDSSIKRSMQQLGVRPMASQSLRFLLTLLEEYPAQAPAITDTVYEAMQTGDMTRFVELFPSTEQESSQSDLTLTEMKKTMEEEKRALAGDPAHTPSLGGGSDPPLGGPPAHGGASGPALFTGPPPVAQSETPKKSSPLSADLGGYGEHSQPPPAAGRLPGASPTTSGYSRMYRAENDIAKLTEEVGKIGGGLEQVKREAKSTNGMLKKVLRAVNSLTKKGEGE